MRKVLLATTALVAVAGVTAANADISISGNYEFEYVTDDDGAEFLDDSSLKVTASTAADNGMTWTAVQSLGGGSDAAGDINMDSAYVQVTGDFGRVIFGDAENSAAQVLSSPLGRNQDIEGQLGQGSAETRIGIGGLSDITWYSPNISGFQVGVSKDLTDADASTTDGTTDFGIKYSMAGATVFYGATEDLASVGVSASLAGFTVGVGSKSESGTSVKANDVGVNYTLANGIKIAALSANGTDSAGAKTKRSNFGASYSIVPGVNLNAETGKLGSTNYTWVAVNMSF
jgi:hypothetical protein